jgi:biotin carboxyl carrier protein
MEVRIGENAIFEVEKQNTDYTLNGKAFEGDIQQIDELSFHALYQNQSHRVEVRQINSEEKTVTLRINGKTQTLQIADKMDILLKKMGFQNTANQQATNLKAPMPGLVTDILVQEGQSIEKGQPLLILEAMKMENALKAAGAGVVKTIKVVKKQNVEKGAILIEFQ